MKVKYVGKSKSSSQRIKIGTEIFEKGQWIDLPINYDSYKNGQDMFNVLGFDFKFNNVTRESLGDICDGDSMLILRKFGGLGDILMQSQIFPVIRKMFPKSNITYAIPTQFHRLFDNCQDIDSIIDVKLIESNIPRIFAKAEYDFFSDISSSCYIGEMKEIKDHGCVERSRQQIWGESMGLYDGQYKGTSIVILEDEVKNAREKYFPNVDKKIVCIVPVSAEKTRSYPEDYTLKLINLLSERFHVVCMDDKNHKDFPCQQIIAQDFREMGAIIKNIDCMVSVDTGPLHFAGILGIPIVGIFGITDAMARLKHYKSQYIQGECSQGRLPCWYSDNSQCIDKKSDSASCMFIEPERIMRLVDQAFIPKITKCRVCGSSDLYEYVNLGMMPLVNQLESTKSEALSLPRFPLEVLFCGKCGLSQLSCVVSPELMFKDYPYRSSISKTFVKHCDDLASYYCDTFNLKSKDYVMDIASNDGTLLESFKKKKVQVIGIEPASNLAKIANENKIQTINNFWVSDVADIVLNKFGKMKLIFATNVFAHVDNVIDFLANAKKCLAEDGRIILEFPYLMNLIRNNIFDTIYHEHLSYFSVEPLMKLAEKCGLIISDIIEDKIHGGSIRIEFALKKDEKYQGNRIKFFQLVEKTDGYNNPAFYEKWGSKISKVIAEIKQNLKDLKSKGNTIAAFGAAAKGNILLNSIQADSNLISYIVDDTPEKIGKFAPGTGIPIVSREELKKNPPDYLLILPWNFKDEIIANTADIYKGKYIVALPTIKQIHNRIKKICIATTFDKNYKEAGKTLFKSIRQHTDCTGIDFKVITSDVDVLKEFGKDNCHFITEDIKARYSNVKYSSDLPAEKYSSSWYRYEIFNMTDYDRVICIDSDCICVEDISYLFSEELNQYDLISVEDHIVSKCFSKLVPELERQGLRLANLRKRMETGKVDIQPALLVANKSIVNSQWYSKLLDYANTAPFSYSIDEGILNDFIYMENLNIKLLPLEWDYQDIYEKVCPEMPVPSKPIIVHCQESKPFKKLKTQIEKPFHKWHDLWWKENRENQSKTLIVVIVWNRFENLQRWINCWNQCDKAGTELVVIHNQESDNHRYWKLCDDSGIRYVARENAGFDIGAFQDVCKERLPNFPNDWDNLIWITDDCVPMSKDFVKHFLDKLSDTELPCYEISNEVKKHIRTTGFMVTKQISKSLIFPADPIHSREDCYQFEHKSKSAIFEQIVGMGKKPVMVADDLQLSPLWDSGVRANLNLMNKHEEVFSTVESNIPEIAVDSVLDKMAIKHKSDKSSLYHNYAVKYDKILSPFRECFSSILEIGVAQGQSVRMWTDYFTKAIIHGADISKASENCESYSKRIKFHILDQRDAAQLKNLEQFSPFDLIIDDGNHFWMEQILTFNTLFPYVRKGGIYIVEDTTTSYWNAYKNNSISPIEFFKTLVDDVHLQGAKGSVPANPPQEFNDWEKGWHRREDCHKSVPAFESIQFMNGFIVIYKR
jgi:ADP-heptose:LPS heptosyltransferase/lipopolysaccharide biosynthesis glycosyltransferase/SAM-dependent methyltransferase